jgi:hypothetical protein
MPANADEKVAEALKPADDMVLRGSGYEHLNFPTVHQSIGNDMFYEPTQLTRTSRSNSQE